MHQSTQSKNDLGSLIDEFDREHQPAGKGGGGRGGPVFGDLKRVILGGLSLVATIAALAFLATRVGGGPPDAGAASRVRVAMDSVTGEVFERFRIKDGDVMPWAHPTTGERTVYPIEKCYWTSSGSAKATPTYVILNEMKGQQGPTVCPDCGREVVRHNPLPPPDQLLRALEDARERGDL